MTTRPGFQPRWGWLAALALALPLPARVAAQARLFRSDSVLDLTLRTDLRDLVRDHDPDKAPWRVATISYAGSDGPVSVPLRVRTRGLWRRKNCDYPPISLRFADSATHGTVFKGLHRGKLVVHCQSGSGFEQLILKEYSAYKVLQLLTPASLAVRLVRVTYEDSTARAQPVTRYAIITETPDRLVKRLHGLVLAGGAPQQEDLSAYQAALLGVFEYFIGNTDWSMPGNHNIVTFTAADSTYALPFDFDWAGLVDAPYARPGSKLPISSVRDRIWRGRCMTRAELEPILARFEALRDTITALYRAIPGMEPRTLERTLSYSDDFYKAIADRARFVRNVVERDCAP